MPGEATTNMMNGAPAAKPVTPVAATVDPNPSGNGTAATANSKTESTTTTPAANPNEGKTAEDQRLASRFALMTKKETELRRQEQAIKAREEALKKTMTVDVLRAKASENPIEALKELGLTYEQITKHLLNDGKVTPEDLNKKVTERIEGLEKKLTEKEQKEQDDYRRQVENSFKQDIKGNLEKSEAELLRTFPYASDIVYARMDHIFRKDGKMLKIDEAVAMIEKDLYSQAETFLKTEKGKALAKQLLGVADKPQNPEGKNPVEIKPVTPTLTNSMASVPTKPGSKLLPREESLAIAASMLKHSS